MESTTVEGLDHYNLKDDRYGSRDEYAVHVSGTKSARLAFGAWLADMQDAVATADALVTELRARSATKDDAHLATRLAEVEKFLARVRLVEVE